ncbi:MAG: superoxide dismutase family protein [Acidobacteria bacterium]|nr:superoxide dismutase family protein [Acidobacteriota bacterium]
MKTAFTVAALTLGVGVLGLHAQAPVKVELRTPQGQVVGTAEATSTQGGGVRFALDLKGLPAGPHAIHIHETPKCEPPDFMSAGGHLNPEKKKHGLENPEGPHRGDMPNITIGADGTLKTTVTNSAASLSGANSLLTTGAALVIHASADDMKTDPSGNAGARIACGVIAPSKASGQ